MRSMSTRRCITLILAAATLVGPAWISAQEAVSSPARNAARGEPAGVRLDFAGRPLGDVVADIQKRSGIAFSLPAALDRVVVTVNTVAPDWSTAVTAFLRDFNHVDVQDSAGGFQKVMVAGQVGDGHAAPAAAPMAARVEYRDDRLFSYRDVTRRPATFDGLPAKAITAIHFDRAQLEAMRLGEQMPVVLPSGQYDLVHDNRVTHENGDFTWIGYLRDDGIAYRAAITLGADGTYGQISTREGLFRIEPADGNDWLVDVNAAGLTHGAALEDDEQTPPIAMARQFRGKGSRTPPESPVNTGPAIAAMAPGGQTVPGATVIDVLVVYTEKFARNGSPGSRINNLLALSNQAYADSQVPIRLRIVKSARVNYSESNSNSLALSALTKGSGSLSIVKTLRKQYGADLVTMLRPFNYFGNKNCGTGWVNGSDGHPLTASYSFSVVGDGRSGSFYCPDYSMVHEMSHNMGSAHDRANAGNPGHFAYSYGYSIPGTFGTVMSYETMRLGLFSNPRSSACNGYVCGIDAGSPAGADNARSLTEVRETVANFVDAVVP